jgi:hypothetical protein
MSIKMLYVFFVFILEATIQVRTMWVGLQASRASHKALIFGTCGGSRQIAFEMPIFRVSGLSLNFPES